jgi:UDP-N-acetylglucosamine 2-epimerase (non-hydrolysing)
VDFPERLAVICEGLRLVAEDTGLPIVWSLHPRTRGKLEQAGIELHSNVQLHEPFGFLDFVRLEASARCVVTDSGTVQEECSLMHVPAVTCRDTTERPETVECGSNILCGTSDPVRMLDCVRVVLSTPPEWESPYEGPLHRGVAAKVVKYLLGHAGTASSP